MQLFQNNHYIQFNSMSLVIDYLIKIANESILNYNERYANIFLKYSPIIRNECLKTNNLQS